VIFEQENELRLRAPFPWFGGKSLIASLVWPRFGDVRNYVEPFAGSLACLLLRPRMVEGTETVNDLDGMVANFWRALQAVPAEVAQYADWPVNECDLHARHLWLVNEGRRHVERLKTEPDYFDAKIAGWWVWGCCQWIGRGWCEHPEWKQLPHLGDAGRGVHRPSQKLHDYIGLLAARLRRVRVCCGDWSRVCGPTPTVKQGLTAVFLDPPYDQHEKLYAVETNVSAAVRRWCLERGDDKLIRIALCGYEGEGHEELEQHGWDVLEWKANGGYGSQGTDRPGAANAARERIWFSPCCLPAVAAATLFDGVAT